jgi:hypothetical protein
MMLSRVPMLAWLRLKPDPFATALALMPALKADLRALRSYVAETRVAIAVLRETWRCPRAATRSSRRRSSARTNRARRNSRRGNGMRVS